MAKITRYGLASPEDASTRSHAPADAEVIQTLAGRARWLHEMATGQSAVTDEAAGCGVNPQGTVGHDHSGPPFGSSFQHPLFSYAGIVSSTWQINTSALTYNALLLCGSTGGDAAIARMVFDVWVPPWATTHNAPRSRGHLTIVAHNTTATTRTLTCRTWTGADPNTKASNTASVSASSWPGDIVTFTGEPYWRLVPGRNRIFIDFDNDSDTVGTYISALSGNVIVKRSH